MQSFEQEIKAYFVQNQIQYEDNSKSLTKFDFSFGDREKKTYFSFDVKEKRQHYNIKNWQEFEIPEPYLFIIDDLAARKILASAPNSGLGIRDNYHQRYCFFSIVDLYLIPKKRVNRVIKKQGEALKGKWLIDLRNGKSCHKLSEMFAAIESYLTNRKNIFLGKLECYGSYYAEKIGQGGITRKPEYWKIDVNRTR